MEFGTAEQKARYPAAMASSEEIWAQGWSEPNAGSDMAAIRATARRDGDHYVLNGQKTWCLARRLRRLALRPLPHRSRLGAPQRPQLHPGAARRARRARCGRSRSSTARPASPRCSSTTRACRVANRLGEEDEGWKVAMATAGFERGLMLRSPARFQATARAPRRALPRSSAATPTRRCATPWSRALDGRRGLHASTPTARRRASLAGGKIGAEASLNKIFWSELDVRMHETALAHPRRARRAAARGARRARRRRLARRLPLLARRPDLRRHQRDPAQRHRRAHARPAAELSDATSRFNEDQLLLPRQRARLPRDGVHARARARALGRRRRRRSPDALDAARRARARRARSCPRRTAASASTRSTSCCSLEEAGAPRCPSRSSTPRRSAVPLLAALGDERAGGARGCRASRPARRRSPSAIPANAFVADAARRRPAAAATRRRAPRRAARRA